MVASSANRAVRNDRRCRNVIANERRVDKPWHIKKCPARGSRRARDIVAYQQQVNIIRISSRTHLDETSQGFLCLRKISHVNIDLIFDQHQTKIDDLGDIDPQ